MRERDAIEPHIWTQDLETLRRFYVDALDFEVVQHFPEDAPTWFQLRRGASFLMLACLPEKDPAGPMAFLSRLRERPGGGALSLYLTVADAEAELARCEAVGAKIVEPLWDPWWGGRELTVEDPDGHWWTLYQRRSAEG